MKFLAAVLLAVQAPRPESKFEQIAPEPPLGKLIARTDGQTRAVVLLPGLTAHPFSKENVGRPLLRDWQASESKLVSRLIKHADVFAFAYSQDVPVETIATASTLPDNVRTLRALGYTEIVLVGHSAGGLVARHFVEDNPESGVTRVIQVCSPNAGSSWAKLPAVRRNQMSFLRSLTRDHRRTLLDDRKEKRIPGGVQFVCVVGTGAPGGDGLVARESQWSSDLRKQGIPVVALDVTHVSAMRSAKSAEALAKLVLKDLPRWEEARVARARKEILTD